MNDNDKGTDRLSQWVEVEQRFPIANDHPHLQMFTYGLLHALLSVVSIELDVSPTPTPTQSIEHGDREKQDKRIVPLRTDLDIRIILHIRIIGPFHKQYIARFFLLNLILKLCKQDGGRSIQYVTYCSFYNVEEICRVAWHQT